MKASELRIGNLVDTKEHKSIVISSINSITDEIGYVWNNHNFGYYQLKTFQPIQLTEEWLLKFGFVKREGERWCDTHEEFEECVYYNLTMFELYYNPESGYYTDNSFEHELKLEYVHQLQNLYFALTGEELTLKP